MTFPAKCGTIQQYHLEGDFVCIEHKGIAQKAFRVGEGNLYVWHRATKEEIPIPLKFIETLSVTPPGE